MTVPRRDTSTMASAPRCARASDASKPNPPVPPVTKWQPFNGGTEGTTPFADASACMTPGLWCSQGNTASRGAQAEPPRNASSVSHPEWSKEAKASATSFAPWASTSASLTEIQGASNRRLRAMPHKAASKGFPRWPTMGPNCASGHAIVTTTKALRCRRCWHNACAAARNSQILANSGAPPASPSGVRLSDSPAPCSARRKSRVGEPFGWVLVVLPPPSCLMLKHLRPKSPITTFISGRLAGD
mmetsp:Transcript_73527/g.237898  ORF Transcript_73527/g.237898 Transcript_73527/m.237898 type:complete len:244 (+) Transcript_73527:428-1159(+)